jgi:hypothetical protein
MRLDPTRRADVAPRALALINDELGKFSGRLRIIAGAGGGGMNPRFFPVPI